jgi:hypothetical protein
MYDRAHVLDLPPMQSLRQDVGIAVSNDSSRASTPPIVHPSHPLAVPNPAVTPTVPPRHPLPTLADNTPASARAALAKQHQRARTRRAFAAPSAGPVRPKSNQFENLASPCSAALLSASTNSAHSAYTTVSSDATPTPHPRRPSAMEEAIGRSRAASLTGPESGPSGAQTRPGPRTADKSTYSHSGSSTPAARPIPDPIQRTISPPLAYPISTIPSPRSIVESFAEQQNRLMPPSASRPRFAHTDTAASGRTVYTDASEGWDRSAAGTPDEHLSPEGTPSPDHDDGDFKVCTTFYCSQDVADKQGLFFRTPQDAGSEFAPKYVPSFRPKRGSVEFPLVVPSNKAVGLGYDVPGPSSEIKRDSGGAFSVDSVIVTPTLRPDGQIADPSGTSDRRGSSPSSSRGHIPSHVRHGHRRPPSLQNSADYGLSRHAGTDTDLGATSGKRRASVPDASLLRSLNPLSPETFGIHLPNDRTYLDLPRQTTGAGFTSQEQTRGSSAVSPHLSIDSPLSDDRRHSAAVSFIDDFPAPPSTTTDTMNRLEGPAGKHASAFGQLVTGPPGAGKTTYCNGMHQVSF